MSGNFLRRSVPYVYLAGGACAGLAIMYPHTIGLEHYKDLMAIQTEDGQIEKVDEEILNLAEEINKDYGWSKRALESTENINMFPSSSMEFCHLGTAKTKWGSYLGIPKYYLLKYQQDETHLNELFNLLNIESSSEAANDIRQSFNISDDAKKYAIAREMKLCKNYQMFFMIAGAQIGVGSFYLIPNVVNALLPFPGVKFVSFVLLMPLMYFSSKRIFESSSRFTLKGADQAAANISYEVASGGVEYYNSMILRQKVIGNVKKEKSGNSLFFEFVTQSWNNALMTLEERKEELERLVETVYKMN